MVFDRVSIGCQDLAVCNNPCPAEPGLILYENNVGCIRYGPQGGVLAYFHTYVGLGHFFWLKILNFDIFRGFSEKNILRYEDFVDIFWGNHTIGLY